MECSLNSLLIMGVANCYFGQKHFVSVVNTLIFSMWMTKGVWPKVKIFLFI